jgi:ribosomal protein L17
MENKESYYMNIPAPVWDSGMNAKAILMYGHVTVLANKKGYCYASNAYFEKVLNVSDTTVGRYLNQLESKGFISRKLIYKEESKEVAERRIYMNTGMHTSEHGPMFKNEAGPMFKNEQVNTTSNNTTSTNTTAYDGIYDKLIKDWPKTRIHSKGPVIKYLKTKSKDELILILKNKSRYLKANEGFIKNLRNYLEHEDWSEESIKQYETKRKPGTITNEVINNADSFTNKDKGFYE